MKFCSTPNTIDKSILKEDLEKFGRKLRLEWHYRNDNRIFHPNPFKHKSKFNPPKSYAAIELYLSRLEQKLLNLGPIKYKYNNLNREERKALYDLRNDTSIIIKEADKGPVVVIWDNEDYLKEAEEQLSCKKMYKEFTDDPSPIIETMHGTLEKIRKRGDIDSYTLKYFDVEEPKFGRFYLLPKIHKRLHSIPSRPITSNSGFYTGNISAFLDFHLKSIAEKIKSYIKDTNDFLRKLQNLPKVPYGVILCTIDVVGLYPNIPNGKGLLFLKKSIR